MMAVRRIPGVILLLSVGAGCSQAQETTTTPARDAQALSDAGGGVSGEGGARRTADSAVTTPPDGTAVTPISRDAGPVLVNASTYNTVLGRPTDSSIAVSVLAAAAGDKVWIEYGTALDAAGGSIASAQNTAATASQSGEPIVIDVTGLSADTPYYYRVHYQPAGQGDQVDNLHTFHTQRAPESTFHFGVQGDTHPERNQNKMFNAELFTLTMQQVRDHQPDMYFMLGDDFSIEDIIQDFEDANFASGYKFTQAVEGVEPYSQYSALPSPFSEPMIVDGASAPKSNGAYLQNRQQYLGIMANATSLFLVNGNHEQAHLANVGGIFNNAAVWAADGRLKYYPLPGAGAFYSVDTDTMTAVNGYPTISASDGLLRDYYAFTWGDALFVTIDPYWHAPDEPESSLYNGDKSTSSDIWNATMGDAQYEWLKQTLESSTARWKFIFTHHINGTGRGGAACVGDGEWGASLSELQTYHPTWTKPIHQLLADTKVTVFFQGHDHMFSREVVDGVVYQEVPNPGDNSYFAYNCTAYAPSSITWTGPSGYGVYDPTYSVKMPNTGYLDVTVSPSAVHVDYVRTFRAVDLQTNPNKVFTGSEVNGEVAFSYSIPAQPGDDQAADFPYTCIGDEPPSGWVYNP
jgi:hypothetical protein